MLANYKPCSISQRAKSRTPMTSIKASLTNISSRPRERAAFVRNGDTANPSAQHIGILVEDLLSAQATTTCCGVRLPIRVLERQY